MNAITEYTERKRLTSRHCPVHTIIETPDAPEIREAAWFQLFEIRRKFKPVENSRRKHHRGFRTDKSHR